VANELYNVVHTLAPSASLRTDRDAAVLHTYLTWI